MTVLDSAAGLPCAAARVFECPPGAVGYRESFPAPWPLRAAMGPLVSRDRGAAMALRGPRLWVWVEKNAKLAKNAKVETPGYNC